MKIRILAALLVLVPGVSFAAVRDGNARVGVQRVSMAGARAPNITTASGGNVNGNPTMSSKVSSVAVEVADEVDAAEEIVVSEEVGSAAPKNGNCREAYRACMDEFCLLDESEGYRCACSSNINQSKDLIQEIQKIQEEADKLYTEGV